MKILLSNDDGYRAPGLTTLAEALAPLVQFTVVAPENNCSGASNSLSLYRPLQVVEHAGGNGAYAVYCVRGTPADSVHLAVNGMLDCKPDMVVAGINHGPNLGDDILYSGTVAAAIEGRFLGLPAIAVSLAGTRHYQSAAGVVIRILNHLRARPLPQDTILNINVPDLPFEQLRGLRATRLGRHHRSRPIIAETAEAGVWRSYRIGPPGDGADVGPGTDFYAVGEAAVSVTPLQIDMTRHRSVDSIADWLGGIRG
ncbi:MAG: 5'/3'-nucleotidase SurE [Gammaproteobacteria bacterium]|nr:5'/3'-nucleotidase SurE [Gammaproteobacteria bacterium]